MNLEATDIGLGGIQCTSKALLARTIYEPRVHTARLDQQITVGAQVLNMEPAQGGGSHWDCDFVGARVNDFGPVSVSCHARGAAALGFFTRRRGFGSSMCGPKIRDGFWFEDFGVSGSSLPAPSS